MGTTRLAAMVTYSAWALRLSLMPMTASPTRRWSTPVPSSTMDPAKSLPWPSPGKRAGKKSRMAPSRMTISPGLIPAYWTFTRTCPLVGGMTFTSRMWSTEESPYSSNRTAFMELSFCAPRGPKRIDSN